MADRADRFDRSDFDGRPAVQPVKAVLSDNNDPYDYIVQPGDTLERIAASWLGDAAQWPRLVEANRSRIKDPNLIKPGLKLIIPPESEPPIASHNTVRGQRVPQVAGTRQPRDAARLMRVYLTYKNLARLERIRFLKLLDEAEQDYSKEDWKKADLDWLSALVGTPLPLDDAVALYRAYKRLPIAQQMSLARAAIEKESGFTMDEMKQTLVKKIDPAELEPNWKTTI
jgi:LysM repeat protein